MFWRRRPEPEETEPAVELPSELAPVRIYMADAIIDGWVDIAQQRLSDVLNVEDLLSVSTVGTAPTDKDWFVVERERMLIVVPPPHAADRKVRLHRLKRPVIATIGELVVHGSVHLIAGIALDATLARSRQYFVPVTNARISSVVRPEMDERYDAVLLNIRNPIAAIQLEVVE